MTFYADLHIHSRFSRATSSRLTLPHLAGWGLAKGLTVVSTGDFTHPEWRAELRRDLVWDEASGLYRLRAGQQPDAVLPESARPDGVNAAAGQGGPLFVLQAEISSIYKKDGAVRKVHNLVYMPDLDSADKFSRRLEAIGNLASDGRPILGLDSRHLLDIVLETDPRGVLVPAHIWTPWFSLFGSKSGFDSLEACFGDLSQHVFALETGLSSDPEMNRLWSHLDRFALISNSDAHSGENLAREANVFSGSPSYDGLFNALRRSAAGLDAHAPEDCRFEGTLEFFPEEGKYHLDGHRACNVVLEPGEALRLGNLCPVCGKPLTIGVLHRVVELADRSEPAAVGAGFHSLVPLAELVGECLGVGSKSRKVADRYAGILQRFGSELAVLREVSEADLRAHWEPLGEAVARMRAGQVIREGGYDGEYGVVRVFAPEERAELRSGGARGRGLLDAAPKKRGRPAQNAPTSEETVKTTTRKARETMPLLDALGAFAAVREAAAPASAVSPASAAPTASVAEKALPVESKPVFAWTPAQQTAMAAGPGPVLVLAGPGSGKTRTLIGRLTSLLAEGVAPARLAAVTFTRRAAAELRERLARAVASESSAQPGQGATVELPRADTLHALALAHWPGARQPAVLSEESAWNQFVMANAGETAATLRDAWTRLALARERREEPDTALQRFMERYAAQKTRRQAADYTDLLEAWLQRLENGEARPDWQHLLVDEVQDLSRLQLDLVRALRPPDGTGFFGIGDPDQAIYGFRGAQPEVEQTLRAFWPDLCTVALRESYRSAPAILTSASALLGAAGVSGNLIPARQLTAALHHFGAPTAAQEAAWVAERISRLVGGVSHTLQDSRQGREAETLATPCSPGDIAVLVRLKQLMPLLRDALHKRGIPCAVPETDPFWAEPRVQFLLALAGRRHGRPSVQPVPDPSSLPAGVWADGPVALLRHLENTPPFDPDFGETKAFRELHKAWTAEGGWLGLLDWLQTRQEADAVRAVSEQVQIMTLHASKGLEFRVVFLPCLEEGLVPFAGPGGLVDGGARLEDGERLNEERRLLYVGLTRAEEAVFISHAAERQLYGRTLRLAPSRFIAQMATLFSQRRLVRHAKVTSQQMSLLEHLNIENVQMLSGE